MGCRCLQQNTPSTKSEKLRARGDRRTTEEGERKERGKIKIYDENKSKQ